MTDVIHEAVSDVDKWVSSGYEFKKGWEPLTSLDFAFCRNLIRSKGKRQV